jgi:peptide chain release factor subunit 1
MSPSLSPTASAHGDQTLRRALEAADELLTAERLQRIEGFAHEDLDVLSIYLSVPPLPGDAHAAGTSKADSLLHQIRPRAQDGSLAHDRRVSLRGDIEDVAAIVAEMPVTPGAYAIFSCHGAGFLEVVKTPRAVRDRIIVQQTPWIRPLLAVLAAYHRCLAVVVDKQRALAWELYLGQVRDEGRLEGRRDGTPPPTHVNERRNQRRADELEERHLRQVAAALNARLTGVRGELVALGGQDEQLQRLLPLLSDQVRARVIGTFSLSDNAITPATVREEAEAILDRYELEHEQRSVRELFERSAAGGLAAIGLEDCLWAGSSAAIEVLYVQDGAVRPGVVCDRSRWFGLRGERCPLCGDLTRETPDVIEELTEAVIAESGSIRAVRTETALQDALLAAALRFEPPSPAGDAAAPPA